MYYLLTRQLKNIIKDELQAHYQLHPWLDDVDVVTMQPLKERPSRGVVVATGGTNFTQLSGDQHLGTLSGYPILARIKDKPCQAIEWVKEDYVYSQGGNELSPAGKYFIEITSETEFTVSKQFKIVDEIIVEDAAGGETSFNLAHENIVEGSEVVTANDPFTIFEGGQYIMDYDNGVFRWKDAGGVPEGWDLSITYEYQHEVTDTYTYEKMRANNKAIPGVVLAFGDRVAIGDRQVVIIQEERSTTHIVKGGVHTIDVELAFTAKDLDTLGAMVDIASMFFWATDKDRFDDEYDVMIQELSIGSEAAEMYDDTTGEYEYVNTISMTCMCSWNVFYPLPRIISIIWPYMRLDGPDLSETDLRQYTPTRASSLEITTASTPFVDTTVWDQERMR